MINSGETQGTEDHVIDTESPSQNPRPGRNLPGTEDVSKYDGQPVAHHVPDAVVIQGPIPVRPPSTLERWKSKGGVLGTIASILLFLMKAGSAIIALLSQFKFLAIMLKLALGGGSMLLSMWLMSKAFGWGIAVGIVLLIFIHECGHALAARLRGIPTGIMVFIPFLGAFVTTKRGGRNLEEDAFIGIMGPVVGSVASVGCVAIGTVTHNPFWLMLGEWGIFINLFNLLPTPPLDGGWISPLFSPKLMAFGVVIAVVVGFRNPLIWALLVLSIPRIIHGWRADPKTQPYYQVASAVKWKYGIAYLGLAVFLAVSEVSVQHLLNTATP
jgi:Zn-dependent protease